MASIINVEQIEGKNNTITVGGNVRLDLSDTNTYMLLPAGTDANRPANPGGPAIRWNTDGDTLDVFDGTRWIYAKRYYDVNTVPSDGLALNLDFGNYDSFHGETGQPFTKLYDATFNPYWATPSGNPSFVIDPGPVPHVDLNGSGQYLRFDIPVANNNSYMTPLGNFAHEAWFKMPTAPGGTDTIANVQYGLSSGKTIHLAITGSNIVAGIRSDSYQTITASHSGLLTTSDWHHVVHSYNGTDLTYTIKANITNGNNNIIVTEGIHNLFNGQTISGIGFPSAATITNVDRSTNTITVNLNSDTTDVDRDLTVTQTSGGYLFFDGNLIGSNTSNTGNLTWDLANNTVLSIGMSFEGNGANTGDVKHFDGKISSYRIYSVPRTLRSVRQGYNAVAERHGRTLIPDNLV